MRPSAWTSLGFPVGVIALLAAGSALALRIPASPPAGHPAPAVEEELMAGEVPERIVSSMTSTDEMLLALLGPGNLLAVSMFADDPDASNVVDLARRVPHRVGHDPESLVALEPDVVFASPYGLASTDTVLRWVGVRVVRMQPADSLDAIEENLLHLGMLVHRPAEAAAIVHRMHSILARAEDLARDRPRPRVLYLGIDGYTAGRNTLFDEELSIAGGINAAAEAGIEGHRPMGLEETLALDPDVILVNEFRADGQSRDLLPSAARTFLAAMRARREGRVFRVRSALLSSTSQFAAEATLHLAQTIHGERLP